MVDLAVELGTQESDVLEFKASIDDRDSLRKAMCALANDLPGRGFGHLLVGVDDRGRPTGLACDDDTLLKVSNIRNEGKVLPPPVIAVDRGLFHGVSVIHVTVQPSTALPVTLDGRIFVRVGPSTRVATHAEEQALIERRRRINISFDHHPVPAATLLDLDTELFRSTYVPAAVPADVLEENGRTDIERLSALGFATPSSVPTVLGMLVVGLDPSDFLPGAYVQFVRYEGTDVTGPVVDQQEIRSNVVWLMQQLERLVAANNRFAVVESSGFEQRERFDYPVRALRECIANAICHRDYESSNAPIRVEWFDDRVEISNPGSPFGIVNADNFASVNDYRNPALAAALKNLGYVNRFGRGIRLIRADLASNGNPPPEFEVGPTFWLTTIRKPA